MLDLQISYIDLIDELQNSNMANMPLLGRNVELNQLISIISSKGIKNVVITGNAGCGKTQFADALAWILSNKDLQNQLPKNLRGKRIYKISGSDFKAGSIYHGQEEGKIKSFLEKAEQDNVIVFIDEIHALEKEVLDVFKPFLDGRRNICIIGTSTAEEYNKFIYRDPAFKRRFSELKLRELEDIHVRQILYDKATDLGLNLNEESCDFLLSNAKRHIRDLSSPSREINILNLILGYKTHSYDIRFDESSYTPIVYGKKRKMNPMEDLINLLEKEGKIERGGKKMEKVIQLQM